MSYTRGTFAALVDALVPETPELAGRGEEHVPGGLAVGLEEAVIQRVNGFLETRGLASQVTEAAPLAPVVAVLLEFAALELLLRRRVADGLESPADAFSGGIFARLSREDRLRALRLLEDDGVFPRLSERFDAASLGAVQFLASSIPILVEFVYYSETCGDVDGETYGDVDGKTERQAAAGRHDPAESESTATGSLGWRQADYPGPADGYPVLVGYELDEFEENEY